MQDTKIGHFILAGEVSRKRREIVKNCEGKAEMAPLSVKDSGAVKVVLVHYCCGVC